ncbi:hypothetical protein [Flavobacterium sp. J27]|uniref:hypothetical protein n=1 Tax=Flavobacterium sp. J27 TaxID=2060419 RepID=UPI00103274F5|nr:hypothetical protein [Flavobacterium sp. J27]
MRKKLLITTLLFSFQFQFQAQETFNGKLEIATGIISEITYYNVAELMKNFNYEFAGNFESVYNKNFIKPETVDLKEDFMRFYFSEETEMLKMIYVQFNREQFLDAVNQLSKNGYQSRKMEFMKFANPLRWAKTTVSPFRFITVDSSNVICVLYFGSK